MRRRLMLDWGATMPEYALMVGLILLVALLGAQSLGLAVKFRFDEAVRLWPG